MIRDWTNLDSNLVALLVSDFFLKIKPDVQFVLGEVDQASLLDFTLKDRPRVHLDIWVCHVEHCINLYGQDYEHEDVYGEGEPCPEPGLVSLAALIVE